MNEQAIGTGGVALGVIKAMKETPAKIDSLAAVGIPAASWWAAFVSEANIVAALLITLGGAILLYFRIRAARAEAIIKEAEAKKVLNDEFRLL